MRIAKRLLAVLLSALMLLSVCAFSASAVTAPEFNLTLVSETDKEAVIRVTFVKGDFNAFDATFVTSSAITGCTAIESSAAGFSLNMGNAQTKKITAVAMSDVPDGTLVCTATFAKKTSAKVTESDIKLVFDSCAATVNSSNGLQNVDVTDLVKITVSFKSFTLGETSIATNYKETVTVNYETNYAPEELTWTSSNENVAQVDESGNIYASGTGSATITVTSADGLVNETVEVEVTYTVLQWIIVILLFGWIWY
ncbi:MAG: Ig-like domain-containing protein [Clostridia bacterium]|nr:Ig-like domain-containing protein [Clostridia bacterium]